jgi:o-succinylbenzoate synthase
MKIHFEKYQLTFKKPVLTSRGEMKVKNGYFLHVEDNEKKGTGECSFIEGLSSDNLLHYEATLKEISANPYPYLQYPEKLQVQFPSIRFGIEIATRSLNCSNGILFSNPFSLGEEGIPIHGLVWMGNEEFIQQQIDEKIADGFSCIKLKVGALDFYTELRIIEKIRKQLPASKIEIRLDANGAFGANDVFEKLKLLSSFSVHSIEQPVAPRQMSLMREVCASKLIPVALDEELIGVNKVSERRELLTDIRPDYIILKPSLLGGFASCDEWIDIAESLKIGWWATSALESNIGLNAIAQWVASKNVSTYQGLGTGLLYVNNVSSNLEIRNGALWIKRY